MDPESHNRYYMSFVRNGKVIEQHVLYSNEQVQVFTAIGRKKGCEVEVYGVDMLENPTYPNNNDISIINITEPENKDWSKTIRCVETGQIFATIRDCSKKTGIPYMTIYNCINNKNATRGLHFVLHDGDIPEEIKAKKDELRNCLRKANKGRCSKSIICLNDGRKFTSVMELLSEYRLSSNTFYRNMRLGKTTNGLRFQYV